MGDTTLTLTAKIVPVFVGNNAVRADQLPTLIREVHRTLAAVGEAPATRAQIEPAVGVKKSIFAVLCSSRHHDIATSGRRIFYHMRHGNAHHSAKGVMLPDRRTMKVTRVRLQHVPPQAGFEGGYSEGCGGESVSAGTG
jgi:hypothetical protein